MKTRRPNILFILTDQQRWDTIGANGNRQIFTPHLDRLSAEGVVFDRAYCSSPECVPARAVIMIGGCGRKPSAPARRRILVCDIPAS